MRFFYQLPYLSIPGFYPWSRYYLTHPYPDYLKDSMDPQPNKLLELQKLSKFNLLPDLFNMERIKT
jgi:hypothetical protein